MNDLWLKYDAPDDEEASHEANVTLSETGFLVSWSHTAVGLVSTTDFDTLSDAYDWLQKAGYEYIGEGED